MRLTREERGALVDLLVRLTETARIVEDATVIISTSRKASAKKSETFLRPLQDAIAGLRDSLAIIGGLMNPTGEAQNLTGQFVLEAMSMDTHHARKLAEEFVEELMGAHTVLDDMVDALEEEQLPPPREDVRAWVYVEDGKIHIEISKPFDDGEPEMVGSFTPDQVKEAHEFLVKANVARGMYASSCFHPDEEGLPEDLDVQEWVRKARNWDG